MGCGASASKERYASSEPQTNNNNVYQTGSPGAIERAAAILKDGAVIALPTDTLYGVAACACSTAGIRSIYAIKRRDPKVPLAICVGDPSDVEHYAETAHLPEGLLAHLLPGPVTLLLARKPSGELSDDLNPGVELVGVRVPDSDFVRGVARAHGKAVALTSANKSGAPSTLEVGEFEPLWNKCGAVFDGGRIPASRSGSTIVDLSVAGEFGIRRVGETCEDIKRDLREKFNLTERDICIGT